MDLETAQQILRGYIVQHIPLDNLSQPTPNTARSQLAAHLPPGNYTNYGPRGENGPKSPANCDRPTPRNNFNEYDQQNASMQRGDSEKIRGHSRHARYFDNMFHCLFMSLYIYINILLLLLFLCSEFEDNEYYDDDQFYEEV